MIERRIGTIQSERINEDLLNQKFKIDDRSFEDLLGYITTYLEYVNFFNTNNVIDGNWQTIIENDPVIYMVKIIKAPAYKVNLLDTPLNTMNSLLEWYNKIERWHANLVHFEEDILADKIGNILFDLLASRKDDIQNSIEDLKDSSDSNADSNSSEYYINSSKDNNKKGISLDEEVNTFKELILHIQDFTKNYLKAYIFERNNHMPNNAMYITFALLYRKVQESLNDLSKSHLDFYYKNILQQTLRKGKPTHAVLCFEVDPKVNMTLLPESTQFSAGKLFESKKAVLFETDRPVVLSPVTLDAVQTLFFNENPFIKIGTNVSIISNVIKNKLISKGKKVEGVENWSLFGANKNTLINSGITQSTITDIGFMIGSPVLFLEEGKREITLTFKMEESSSKNVFWKLVNEIVANEGFPLDVVFNMVFERTFIISYTSEKGWEPVTAYNLLLDETTNAVSISFILENTKPSLTTLKTEEENTSWPLIKVVFDEYAPIYAYSFFKGVALESVTIDVNVTGAKNLSLYNNVGKMPLAKSFDLFGPLPAVGDYLMVGKSELFKKELQNLDIQIDWAVVPEDYGGFETYYQDYDTSFKNDAFKVELTALSNGYWFPMEEHPPEPISLYTTEPATTPEGYKSVLVSKDRTITINDFEPYKLSQDYNLKDPIKYDIHTENGFFKLTLSDPRYAFGQKAYQDTYAKVVRNNARNDESMPLPNKPFVPKVKEVKLNYKAQDVIHFNSTISNSGSGKITGDYLHITPSGTRKIVGDGQVLVDTMVSDYEGEGYIYIKLSGVQPNTAISMFFDMLNNDPAHPEKSENIVFQYKKSGYWISLPEKYLISDGTNQFTKSGIIELQFPYGTQPLADGAYELRFMARQDAYTYPVINGIYPNAVAVTCICEDENVIGRRIEAQQITKSVTKIPALKQILQPAASYGGETPGTPELFYTEVSERLRHKDRAVTLWDYEHLILQHFGDVIAAKCTNLDGNFKQKPGKVTVVVLSSLWTYENHQYFNANDLAAMTTLLQKRANSFIRIKVQNPEVEWLLVNCILEFEEEGDSGYYMTQLNTVISDYLSPLSNTRTDKLKGIGTGIVPIMLMSHIENLPYVKSVKRLDVEHIVEHGLNNFSMNIHEKNEEIKPTKPWSILVPKLKHNILLSAVLEEETIEEVEMQDLQIGVDYIIAGDNEFTTPKVSETAIVDKKIEREKPVQEDTQEAKPKLNTILTLKTK